jgi:hypothetical protein
LEVEVVVVAVHQSPLLVEVAERQNQEVVEH